MPKGVETCYAPEVAFDRAGTLYYLFVGLAGLGNEPVGVYLTASSDRGRTFLPAWRLLGAGNYQPRMAVDRSAGAHGRLHLVWLRTSEDAPSGGMPAGRNPIVASYSDDGGRTFSPPVEISDPHRALAVAPALAIGSNSAVHVAYYDLGDDVRDYRGLEGPTYEGRWSILLTTSRDGGRTFGPSTVVSDRVAPAGRVMLIFTMPAPALASSDSRLYVAWPDAGNGDGDILVARSSPDGRRWDSPVRANDDPIGSGSDQSLPRLAVAPGGRVDLVFLDRRRDEKNVRFDVYFTSSDDEGRRFSPNVPLTSRSSSSQVGQRYRHPAAEGLFDLGSRLGLVSEEASALAVWPDTRNTAGGTMQDLRSARVAFAGSTAGPPTSSYATVGGLAVAGAVAAVTVVVGVSRRRQRSRRS